MRDGWKCWKCPPDGDSSVHVDVVMILCAGEAVRESLNAWQECAHFRGSYVNILCTCTLIGAGIKCVCNKIYAFNTNATFESRIIIIATHSDK